jgi:hypothetical protein
VTAVEQKPPGAAEANVEQTEQTRPGAAQTAVEQTVHG